MGYAGQTYRVPCDIGGFNANPNTDIIPPTSIIDGSNMNYHQGGKRKRKGTAKVNSTAISGAPHLIGGIDFILNDGTQFQVFASNDGKIYKNTTTTIKTGLTLNTVANFCVFNNTLYHTNRSDTIQTWDGVAASTSNLANPHADWGANNQPRQLLVHGRGNSERLVAIGTQTNPENVYLSANGSDNFATGVKISIKQATTDGGIVGAANFGDTLILFSRRKAYILDDTSTDTANWGYEEAQWSGGAAHFRCICQTPNDIFVMSEDGDIYSIVAVQAKGDYKAASVARPAYIDKWIKNNAASGTTIPSYHMRYDPVRRAVLLFWGITRQSNSAVLGIDIGMNVCLPFYIDRPIEEAWGVPLENTSYACGYAAVDSFLVRKTAGDYVVYTCGYNGFLWELETGTTDDGNAFRWGLMLPYNSMDNVRLNKRFDRLGIVAIPYADTTLSVRAWVDGHLIVGEDNLITEAGDYLLTEDGYYLVTEDEQLWDFSFSTNIDLVEAFNRLGELGKRIKIEIFNEAAASDALISQVLFDFKPLSVLPQ